MCSSCTETLSAVTFTGPICEECDFLEGNETRILPRTYILFGLCKVCYPWIYLLSSVVVKVACLQLGYYCPLVMAV